MAVKASKQKCKDPLFSFLSNIESYQICCSDNNFADSAVSTIKDDKQVDDEDDDVDENIPYATNGEDLVEASHENTDGTIVLTDDGEYSNITLHYIHSYSTLISINICILFVQMIFVARSPIFARIFAKIPLTPTNAVVGQAILWMIIMWPVHWLTKKMVTSVPTDMLWTNFKESV